MAQNISRRQFFEGAAMGAAGAAAAGALAGAAIADEAGAQGVYDILGTSYSDFHRDPDATPIVFDTPEEYIADQQARGGGTIMLHFGGGCGSLGITPADFMLNVPAWLGEKPDLGEVPVTDECDVLVVGGGNAGALAALHAQDLGAYTICCEVQSANEYDDYACDMAVYNSKFFTDKGTPTYDPIDIFNEYMRKALGRAHQKLIMDYATRSGEMLDFMLENIPEDIVSRYAMASNYKTNADFGIGPDCGQYSFVGLCQWRDLDAAGGDMTNDNMWPYAIRLLLKALEEKGGKMIYGACGMELVQDESGAVTGAIFKDLDGSYFQVNAKAVIMCTGDFGGNPDMALDLLDDCRNLAWSRGLDRTSIESVNAMGRDGSGTRMCLWAGATMETGPRATNGGGSNSKPGFPFGGCWPVFGNDGKRFFNESLAKHGIQGYLDMLPAGLKLACVTDANWESHLASQGYGHETMNRSSDYQVETVHNDMAAYVTGTDGFMVHSFAKYGSDNDYIYAADTLEELADIIGYDEEAKANFIAEVAHWNEMCAAGRDGDWGMDPLHLYPIDTPPFFCNFNTTGSGTPSAMVSMAGVCTDGEYNILKGDKSKIPGLYGAGNTIGQRYGIQYHTPTAGNCCGMAETNGYCAAEYAVAYAKSL